MRLRFIWIGKTRDPLLLELEERYLGRIRRYFPAQRLSVTERKKADPRQHTAQLEREARDLEARIPARSYCVVLDEAGRQYSSPELCGLIEGWSEGAVAEAVFLAGGYLGVPPEISRRAQEKMALSRLTLPHELARVVLLEQIYRAITLMKGSPYHK